MTLKSSLFVNGRSQSGVCCAVCVMEVVIIAALNTYTLIGLCRLTELTQDLESERKSLSERLSELAQSEEHTSELESRVENLQSELLKCEELRREQECVLQELQLRADGLQKLVSMRDSELALREQRSSDLESRVEELQQCEQHSAELESRVQELQSRNDELQRSLDKSRAKTDKLSRVKREIETVLVEQERQVTSYEAQVKQMQVTHDADTEAAREAQRLIDGLRAECDRQQQSIGTQDELVRRLRDELETARTSDERSRGVVKDRDAMIAKLKALVRENQATADAVSTELRTMSEEAKEKNRVIARLRQKCEQLGARCLELEAALLGRTSLDASRLSAADLSLRASGGGGHFVSTGPTTLSDEVGQFAYAGPSLSDRVGGSEASIEIQRHAQDEDDIGGITQRRRQLSATLVSTQSADSDSTLMSDSSSLRRFHQQQQPTCQSAAQPDHTHLSDSAAGGDGDTLAAGGDDEGLAAEEERGQSTAAAAALSATRQQLLRQVSTDISSVRLILPVFINL